jgi:sensor histidine kinase YesM
MTKAKEIIISWRFNDFIPKPLLFLPNVKSVSIWYNKMGIWYKLYIEAEVYTLILFSLTPGMSVDKQELKNKQVIHFLVEDRFRLVRHAVLLLGFLTLLYIAGFQDQFRGVYKFYSLASAYIVFIGMFYVNMYVLVPAFFFKSRYVLYLALVFLLVLTDSAARDYFIYIYLEPHRVVARIPRLNRFEATIISISIILVTTTIKLIQRWIKDNERMAELKNITLNMELKELKNQMNPHFLFNMLNNVKALTRTDPEKASEVIIKLSEFLRYQLYENSEEKTSLTAEMNFLSNFLNLEKIRRDNLSVSIDSKTDTRTRGTVLIPPNLFTTFAENAVKHSVEINGAGAWIRINIEVNNNKLHFICSNSKGDCYKLPDKKNSGLGLVNIKRRLELLYRHEHRLHIDNTDSEYTVHLTIPL